MAETLVCLNGAFVAYDAARLSVEDRSVQFSDGIYEVVRYYGGQPFRMAEHMARLGRSAAGIELTVPPVDEIVAAMDELVHRQGLRDASVYLQITRGAMARFQGLPDNLTPTVIVIARPATSPRPVTGARVVTQSDDRWARCNLKTTMLLPAMLARQRAGRSGAEDAIFIRDGFVTEATAANVFIVRDGIARTPSLSNYLLAGVTRQAVIELLGGAGIAVREDLVAQDDLYSADEVFLTSTNSELRPVVAVDGRVVGTGAAGPVFDRALALFDAAVRQPVGAAV